MCTSVVWHDRRPPLSPCWILLQAVVVCECDSHKISNRLFSAVSHLTSSPIAPARYDYTPQVGTLRCCATLLNDTLQRTAVASLNEAEGHQLLAGGGSTEVGVVGVSPRHGSSDFGDREPRKLSL